MKRIILSIRYENNLSLVSANDKFTSIEFATAYINIFAILFLVRYKLIKERIKQISKYLKKNKSISFIKDN
ncbi:MAG: hypothetical protein PF445_07700 [Melioribacteraceae bacterium]|jgi:hypothetical protein|nr:hypothetical protein [Melioribacteraceae bacterium]